MLGKLLKHEWKATWKIPTILIGILLVLAVVSGIPFTSPIWQQDITGLNILVVMLWMMFYFALIGINIAITIVLAIHFYKSMFTDEGYLTHTLPVTGHQLLISKILPMIVWMFLCTLGILVSVAIFGSMAILFLKPEGLLFRDVINQIMKAIRESEFQLMEMGKMLVSVVFLGITGIINNVMMIVGAVSIGQMVSKHKVLGSIGAYFVLNTAMSIVSGMTIVLIMINNIDTKMNVFQILKPTYYTSGVIAIIISAALYFLSEYLIRKKLNLE